MNPGQSLWSKKLAYLLLPVGEYRAQILLHEPAMNQRLANPATRQVVDVISDHRAAVALLELVPMRLAFVRTLALLIDKLHRRLPNRNRSLSEYLRS